MMEHPRRPAVSLDRRSFLEWLHDLPADRKVGQPNEGSRCPVAEFLRARAPAYRWCVGTRYAIGLDEEGESHLVRLPEWAERLIVELCAELPPGRWVTRRELKTRLETEGFEMEPYQEQLLTSFAALLSPLVTVRPVGTKANALVHLQTTGSISVGQFLREERQLLCRPPRGPREMKQVNDVFRLCSLCEERARGLVVTMRAGYLREQDGRIRQV